MSVMHKYGMEFYSCTICLSDEFDQTDLPRQLQCDHIFHENCINNYINSHKKIPPCPNCRKKVEKKRICFEIFPQSYQVFANIYSQSKGKLDVTLWICQNYTIQDLAHQLYTQYDLYIYDNFILKTSLGKQICITDKIRDFEIQNLSIQKEQTFWLCEKKMIQDQK